VIGFKIQHYNVTLLVNIPEGPH